MEYKTHIVCWVTRKDEEGKEPVFTDHYKVFEAYDDSRLVAEREYEKLLAEEDDLWTANICEVVKSTEAY